jgi:hemin uptake protein HemP
MIDAGSKSPESQPAKRGSPPVVSSRDLFAGHREVLIEHGSERYRLLVTNSNKLILVK